MGNFFPSAHKAAQEREAWNKAHPTEQGPSARNVNTAPEAGAFAGNVPLPQINKFQMPANVHTTQFTGQSATNNPQSTSQGYLSRFGSAQHF